MLGWKDVDTCKITLEGKIQAQKCIAVYTKVKKKNCEVIIKEISGSVKHILSNDSWNY